MASVKVKFRPSTVADREGAIFYQVIHERATKHILTDYHIFPDEWNAKTAKVTFQQTVGYLHNQRTH